MLRLGIVVTLVLGVVATPVFAGSNRAATRAANNAKCRELIAPKHLKNPELKAEWAKCREEGDMYK